MEKVYQIITERIITLLENGTVPWRQPWAGPEHHARNLVSGRKYRGVNVFMLAAAGYDSPYWLSFKQARERGGNVRQGEHGYPCIYWSWIEKKNEETHLPEKIPFLRYYTVFNVKQCDGIEYPTPAKAPREFSPIEECVRVIEKMPNAPKIEHYGDRAVYFPVIDTVAMPKPESFEAAETYYSTLFHELTHSTGHPSRLKRPGICESITFGSPAYAREELVAEMGAAFLCGHTGIENKVIDNSAAYIDTWLSRLRKDHKLVVQAAAQAQRAADYILKIDYKNGEEPATEEAHEKFQGATVAET